MNVDMRALTNNTTEPGWQEQRNVRVHSMPAIQALATAHLGDLADGASAVEKDWAIREAISDLDKIMSLSTADRGALASYIAS